MEYKIKTVTEKIDDKKLVKEIEELEQRLKDKKTRITHNKKECDDEI